MGRDGEFAARGRAREVEEEMMVGMMIRLAVGRKMGLGWEGVGQDLFDSFFFFNCCRAFSLRISSMCAGSDFDQATAEKLEAADGRGKEKCKKGPRSYEIISYGMKDAKGNMMSDT